MQTARELVQALIDAGYTQTEIEAKTGVKQATISRILSGKHADPRSSTVAKLRQMKVRPSRRKNQTPAEPVAA